MSKSPMDRAKTDLDPNSQKYQRLLAEAQAPYRGLRKFVYIAFGASGFIGALVFLAQLLAWRDVSQAFPNFALQTGIVALTIWLFRLESKSESKSK